MLTTSFKLTFGFFWRWLSYSKKNSRNSLCFHLESHSSSLKTLRVRILIYFEFLLLVYISEFCGALLVLIHTNCGNSEVKWFSSERIGKVTVFWLYDRNKTKTILQAEERGLRKARRRGALTQWFSSVACIQDSLISTERRIPGHSNKGGPGNHSEKCCPDL